MKIFGWFKKHFGIKSTNVGRRAFLAGVIALPFLKIPPPAVVAPVVSEWNPVLLSMIRRAMPNLIAYDICGVQPMTAPTGLIFGFRERYAEELKFPNHPRMPGNCYQFSQPNWVNEDHKYYQWSDPIV